jgi:hypothetical protein
VAETALLEVLDRLEDPLAAGVPDVVVGQRDPVDADVRQPVDQRGIGGEDGARGVEPEAIWSRVLEVGDRDVGRRDELADDARVAGAACVGGVPAERRAVLAAARDVRRPAVEREVDPLAVDLDRLVHATVEQDVAAREQRPRRRRIVRRRVRGGGR